MADGERSLSWLRCKPLEIFSASAERTALKRSLGAPGLALLALATIIGTGIFILVAEAAQWAGPAMILSFVIAALVCAGAALCYAEFSSMIPAAGGGYSYAYASAGELVAWLVGWALTAEYMLAASAVSVGWSSYVVGLVEGAHHGLAWFPAIDLPDTLTRGYFAGGLINLPAAFIVMLVTGLLLVGTRAGVTFAIVLLVLKVAALTAFVALAAPAASLDNLQPFAPAGLAGVGAAAASVFFAYLGFDAIASAAEETRDPQRNVPRGILGGLAAATILYLAVAAVAALAVPAQPVVGAAGETLRSGSPEFLARCRELAGFGQAFLSCSDEALAFVLREVGFPRFATILGILVFIALPSAIVGSLFAQSRLLFALARDGFLPARLAAVHPRLGTPVRMILATGLFVTAASALFPVGRLANVANGGTLFVFTVTAVGLLVLRRRRPDYPRPFRLPYAAVTASLSAAGCIGLFVRLPSETLILFAAWMTIGCAVYGLYGARGARRAAAEAPR